MAITFITIKCPECKANLKMEEGREHMFCSYCGSQIIMNNDNEYIYRSIDETAIKQAELEREIRLREIELEERENNRDRKARNIAYIIALVFVAIGVIVTALGGSVGLIILGVGGWIALLTFLKGIDSNNNKHEQNNKRSGMVKMTNAVSEYETKNYKSVEASLRKTGFKNIECVNLKDLVMGILKQPGIIEEITIDGDEPKTGKWYDPNSRIIITYHGFGR